MTHQRRVLVVDDEPMLLGALRAHLEGAGFQVLLASDGATAIRRIRGERPDVILLDLMVPVVDGWGVLATATGDPRRPRVVVLTGKDTRRDWERAWQEGVDEFLTKPVDDVRIVETLLEVLRRSDDQRLARRALALKALERA